jgi:hypothetical protein
MFIGDSADTFTGKFPLVSMGGRADTSSVRRRGARTPIGASGNIVKSNPFPRPSCGRPDCILDKMSEEGCRANCFRESVGYSSTCTRCRENQQQEEGKTPEETTNYSYTGETARAIDLIYQAVSLWRAGCGNTLPPAMVV